MKGNVTKNALSNAFVQLLQKKPIAKITINDIAEECGISRMTFYYHFRDIYDLADWTLQKALHAVFADHHTRDNWQQGFLDLLRVMKENQSLILNVYTSADRELVDRYMRREVEALLLPVVEEQAANIPITQEGKQRVAVFYTYAFMGVVIEWLQKGMQDAPDQIVRVTAALLQGDFRNSLQNLSELEQKGRQA